MREDRIAGLSINNIFRFPTAPHDSHFLVPYAPAFRPQIGAACALVALLLLSGCGKKSEAKQMTFSINADAYQTGAYSLQLYHKGYKVGQTSKTLY